MLAKGLSKNYVLIHGRLDITATWGSYFKDTKIECAIFVARKLTKLCLKLELCSIPFHEQAMTAHGVPNKGPSVRLTGAIQPPSETISSLSILLQGHKNRMCHFCGLKIDQVMPETGAVLNPF